MNTKIALTVALFAASAAAGLASAAPAKAQAVKCWSGYHPDRNGDCQPNNPIPDRQCPQPGLMAQVAPFGAGYICVPIPKGY